jgi:adenosyl cobinamide kinase/adenosyl cobinamide phosphate guanylyltransferase/cobalamin synthase
VITLVLGGVRSGKSEVAESLVGPEPGTYLATGVVAPGDNDFAGRVARHRARRPASWATVEEPYAVPEVLARLEGVVLLDALGTWIANDLEADIDALVKALVHRPGDTIVVSEEVGLGVHPVTEIGRLFADRLGEANRRVAEVADRCLFVVAGRVLDLPAGQDPTDPHPHDLPPTLDRTTTGLTARGGFRQALAFLTPLGGAASPSRAAFVWFPVVGAILGLLLGSIWWTAEDALGVFGAAALVVAADLTLTGALHFDGLVDSADGLLPHLPAERRLAVMAEPHVGAFAIAVGGSTLLLRTAALTALGTARPLLLAALWCLSRTAMAVTALTGRYARTHGLASSFLCESAHKTGAPVTEGSPSTGALWVAPAAIGTVLVCGLALADELGALVAALAAAVAAVGVGAFARRRIGGFTGDTLGAGGVVAETVGLLTAVAVLSP